VLVAGIGESVKGNYVFKEWAHSWARRTIIQSVIRLIAPREHSAAAISNLLDAAAMDRVPLLLHAEARAILQLAPLERFVSSYRLDTEVTLTAVFFRTMAIRLNFVLCFSLRARDRVFR